MENHLPKGYRFFLVLAAERLWCFCKMNLKEEDVICCEVLTTCKNKRYQPTCEVPQGSPFGTQTHNAELKVMWMKNEAQQTENFINKMRSKVHVRTQPIYAM